jgi:cytochrome c553
MWRYATRVIVAVLGIALAPLGASAAETDTAAAALARLSADPAQRQQAIEAGARAADFCANCHGQSGVSVIPEVPNLAAQNPAYLLKQIGAFVAGTRKNDFMEGLMRALGPEERAQVVLYFSSRPAPPGVPADGALVDTGRQAFVSLCARCHGADAHGDASTPRLAGQQDEYLRLSLMRYLTLSGERFYPPMTAEVTKLGKDRIEAVVQYLRTLR